MDTTQLVIIAISITLTVLFVILGIQVYFILKEIRISLQKVNKMLDDGGKVTGVISGTAEGMGGFLTGIKSGLSIFSSLRKRDDHE